MSICRPSGLPPLRPAIRSDVPCGCCRSGRLTGCKSPDVVLHAVALVGASGTRCSLRWIGGGQHLAAMERYAARLGIADRVRFEGQQPADRVAGELRRADLFVLASRTEGLPRALIEAMAAGLPCIGTRVGGIPELLDDEALVAPGDAEALAARIRAFLDDAGLFERQAARNLRESVDLRRPAPAAAARRLPCRPWR